MEFALSLLVLVPLLLGTGAIGINMIRSLATIQLGRDAGHMYARGVDFSDSGNKTILASLGNNIGLSATAGQGKAVVILSALTYVDKNTCAGGGAVDKNGNPSGCTNFGKWVFTQRLSVGNASIRTSNYGSPITSGPNPVIMDSHGKIDITVYVKNSGAVANFSSANGVNPYTVVNNQVSGLPSGQMIYLSEASGLGFGMPPFAGGSPTYSFAFF